MKYSMREVMCWVIPIIIISILLGFNGESEGCLKQEREALLKLKEAFNYPNGSSLPSWSNLTLSDCCTWEAVQCDNSTNRVISLLLNNIRAYELRDFKWSLNISLFRFHQLQDLDLHGNYLSGLFGDIRLTTLEELDLSFNKLTEIPSFVMSLPSLTELVLESNNLNGSLSQQGLLGDVRLANLEFLDLSDNKLTEIPSFAMSLTSLTHLSVYQNNLTGSLSQQGLFGDIRLTNLEVLHLGFNKLTEIPSFVMSLTSLTELALQGNNLNGSLSQQGGLCNLKNLVGLNLAGNELKGELPACLGNLTSLRVLFLHNNAFEGSFPSSLFQTMSSLRVIALSGGYFNGSFSLSLLANNSNLKMFAIGCNNANLKLETENPPFIPSFQLRIFNIHSCTLNEANNNKMPTFLLHQYDLQYLQLTHMNISGTFPSWLLTNNTKLNYVNLSSNLFIGPFELNSTLKLLQMQFFDISSNPIRYEMPSHIGFVLPNLISLSMSSTSLQGYFPASLGEMRQLSDLDLSNNNLSGYLPREFGQGNNELRILKLSNNNLSGPCWPISSNFTNLLLMDLNNNNFKGKFQGGILNSTKLRMLDISANQLFGEIPRWIGNFQHLSYLILSNNFLTGSLPESFCNLIKLTYLDLSQNKFNGSLPNCVDMPLLKFLHLRSNHFMGPLPSTLGNSPLLTLDLMKNNFSGQVPRLLSSLFNLKVLILKGNKLEGPIPVDLCELKEISILDLSQNKLSGKIPYCLNNITFGERDAVLETEIGKFSVSWNTRVFAYMVNMSTGEVTIAEDYKENVTLYRDQEVDFTTKRRYESYKGNILNFMSGLDFSENQLTGEIPSQIGYLSTIHTINLSSNHLEGPIPETFSNLKHIESLDLSHNKLTGHIPGQLIQLYFLSVFSVAYNNLSGMTPDMKNQFSTFGSTSYEGNPFLCGLPLQQKCSSFDKSIVEKNKQHYHLEADDFRDAFLWSFAGAFGITFPGVIIFLYFNYYFHNCRFERKPVRYFLG